MSSKGFKFLTKVFLNILNQLNYNVIQFEPVKWYKTEPNGDGKGAYYNEKGVFDSNEKDNHTVVCVQKIACKLRYCTFCFSVQPNKFYKYVQKSCRVI